MAKVLKKIFIPTTDEVVQNFPIESWHVSQSVDAFTGIDDYDITISGSLVVTGSVAIKDLNNTLQNNVLTYDDTTGLIYYTSSATFAVNNFYTSSVTQSITSSVVNNTINSSTINQTIISSSVNNVAPSDKYIQYNSASAFGADVSFQWNYNISSLQNGSNTSAIGNYAHSEGLTTVASGDASHAEGRDTLSSGPASHTEGYLTTASGLASHAEGKGAIASSDYAHAEGFETLAKGFSSHAEGYRTSASIDYSHAEGNTTRATGWYSHAEGSNTFSTATGSHAEGSNTQATGDASHAEGGATFAQAAFAHTEGFGTYAIGIGGHAEGLSTIARGQYSHTEGSSTISFGGFSHTEGLLTTASVNASYAHVEGWGTVADGNYQHVMGAYNRSSSNAAAFIIGNGTSDTSRSNLVYASGSSFQISGSLNLSGSFSPQYRYIGSVEVANASSGFLLSRSDYNVTFQATVTGVGFKNAIQLPSGMTTGSIIYLQRVSGTTTCAVSGSSGHNINGSAGFTFPTTLFTRRMFVFTGAGWYVEV